jgi:hypothetical protein
LESGALFNQESPLSLTQGNTFACAGESMMTQNSRCSNLSASFVPGFPTPLHFERGFGRGRERQALSLSCSGVAYHIVVPQARYAAKNDA